MVLMVIVVAVVMRASARLMVVVMFVAIKRKGPAGAMAEERAILGRSRYDLWCALAADMAI